MKLYNVMSEYDLAKHYMDSKGSVDLLPTTAAALVADVERWLRESRLDHRLDEAAAIASEAHRIAEQVREQAVPAPSEAEFAWQMNLREGTTAEDAALQRMDEIAFTAQIAQMDMSTFSRNRTRFGLEQDLGAFLAGM